MGILEKPLSMKAGSVTQWSDRIKQRTIRSLRYVPFPDFIFRTDNTHEIAVVRRTVIVLLFSNSLFDKELGKDF